MTIGCPFHLGEDDAPYLRWIRARSVGELAWPTVDEFLIEFRIHEAAVERLCALGMASRCMARLRTTPNGLRVAGDAAGELDALRRLLSAAQVHWRTRRRDAEVEELAAAAGVAAGEAGRILSMAPIGFVPLSGGFAGRLLLGDEILALDPETLAGPEWVPSPPTTALGVLVQLRYAKEAVSPAVYRPVVRDPRWPADHREVVVGANLCAGTLRGGVLSGVCFSRLVAQGATLERIDLSSTRFEDSDFSGATFCRVFASQTRFERCRLVGVRFDACELAAAVFVDCVLDEACAADVLSSAHWDRATVDGVVHTPASWAARIDTPTPPAGDAAPSTEAAAQPLHRFVMNPQGPQVAVVFDGTAIGTLDARQVATRSLEQLVRHRGEVLQVLDLESLVAGHELRSTQADKDTFVRMARALGIRRDFLGEPPPVAWSMLRRLDVLTRSAEATRERRGGATSLEQERAAIVAALENYSYVPMKSRGDPIAACSNRLRQRLETAVRAVARLDPRAGEFVEEHLDHTLETVSFKGERA